jgi:MYXO-CTERM domain-containing protein
MSKLSLGLVLALVTAAPLPAQASPTTPGPEPGLTGVINRRTLYFNHLGADLTPGDDNSSLNTSSIIGEVPRRIPAWSVSEANWELFMACSRRIWAPFNVIVTDQDPGTLAHIEVIIGGAASDAGAFDAGGMSPPTCGIIERSIVFVFPEDLGNSPIYLCSAAAQEIAHSFSLDHAMSCDDPMTYLEHCGTMAFRDRDAPCGEQQERACKCDRGPTQNSYQMLLERAGVNDLEPPTVAVTSPADGAVITPQGEFLVEVTDNNEVVQVQLWADGTYHGADDQAPWAVRAEAPGLPPGHHEIQIRVSDQSGNEALASLTVTVEAECDEATQTGCAEGESCAEGLCKLAMGAACDSPEECASGLCVSTGGFDRVCSQSCSGASACPEGFTCQDTGASGDKCLPGADSGGGGCGCVVGGTPDSPSETLAFLAGSGLVLGALLRRRRARR